LHYISCRCHISILIFSNISSFSGHIFRHFSRCYISHQLFEFTFFFARYISHFHYRFLFTWREQRLSSSVFAGWPRRHFLLLSPIMAHHTHTPTAHTLSGEQVGEVAGRHVCVGSAEIGKAMLQGMVQAGVCAERYRER